VALPWVRLDTQWFANPKFLHLISDRKHRAITAYFAGLAWSGGQGQAGYVPRAALPMIHATTKDADDLSAVRLWVPDEGGWQINDWSEYQPTNEEHERRSQRARDAAAVRWGKQAGGRR
jgi:hypothetical protein